MSASLILDGHFSLSLSLPLPSLTYTLSLLFHLPYFLPLHLDTHLGSSPSRWDTSINSAGSLGSITREGEGAFFPESGYLQQRRSHSGEWVSVLCSVCVLWISVYYPLIVEKRSITSQCHTVQYMILILHLQFSYCTPIWLTNYSVIVSYSMLKVKAYQLIYTVITKQQHRSSLRMTRRWRERPGGTVAYSVIWVNYPVNKRLMSRRQKIGV